MSVASPRLYYEKAPTTDRKGIVLARHYGYAGLPEFVKDIPEGADIADVGAGKSPLGREVCRLRPDVQWLSIDRRYDRMRPHSRLRRTPRNFEFVAGNALDLQTVVGERRFDLVLSYWMLSHIIIDGRELGLAAARNMLAIAKPTGVVAVGPCVALNTRRAAANDTDRPKAVLLDKSPAAAYLAAAVEIDGPASSLERLAEEIVTATTLRPDDEAIIRAWADAPPPLPPPVFEPMGGVVH